MIDTTKHNIKSLALLFISASWIAVCLFLSWQTGEDTEALSSGLTEKIIKLLSAIGIYYTGNFNSIHSLIRRVAHFAVFFFAGLTAEIATNSLQHSSQHIISPASVVTAILCSVVAIMSEVGKVYIPGRHLQWGDAMLNVFGVLVGAGIACFLMGVQHYI